MNYRILKLCNDVLEVGLGGNGGDVDCSNIRCGKCPFVDVGDCVDINEHHIKIAEEFIKNNMNNRELTFKEVIANIKEGEVWESVQSCFQLREISCLEGRINFKLEGLFVDKTDWEVDVVDTGTGNGQTFKLQRKQYTFEEAFNAYEEGKEIESCNYRYKKINGEDGFYSKVSGEWVEDDITFNCEEIRSSWYINY